MVLPIVLYGDPVLRAECPLVTEITDEIRALADDMIDTMIDADGVGLAAPQIGLPLRLAVVDVAHAEEAQSYFRVDGQDAKLADWMPLKFINPKLTFGKRKENDTEGCLSFPDLRAKVVRPASITAQLTLLDGRTITIETDGLLSRAIQHETDHLDGRLFIDRLSSVDRLSVQRRLPGLQQDWADEIARAERAEAKKARLAARKRTESGE
jgi:peptide deformylase